MTDTAAPMDVVAPAGGGAARRLAVRFAVADLVHDRLLSVVGVLLLAALMAPPVVMQTLRVGLVETWARDLARDIRNREVVIVGENRIGAADLAGIATWPETGFVVPEPSFFVATQRARKTDARGGAIDLNLRTTAPGDPVMAGLSGTGPGDTVLSARAASDLDVVAGDSISLLLARTPSDAIPERVAVTLRVAAVLPDARWPGVTGFVDPQVLLGYRDWLTFATDDPDAVPDMQAALWQSLRIYAPDVAGSLALRDRLDAFGLQTRLMTDQVDRILKLEAGLRQIFGIVLALSAIAFAIAALLLQWLSVVRKTRDFALMSVFGLTRSQLILFPAVQGAVLAVLACGLASLLVLALQSPIETIVQGYLSTPAPVSRPAPGPILAGFAVAVALAAGAGVAAVMTLRPDDLSTALRGD